MHKARCKSDRKCQLAIKQYKFISQRSREAFEKEVGAFEILRQTPHKNFINFFGSFFDGESGYIVLEFGKETLWMYLRENKHRLTIAQVNNIAYQMLSMAKHMFDIGFIPFDHLTSNILLCSDSFIKAIDFEHYILRKSELFTSHFKWVLIYAAKTFFLLQLEIKCRNEGLRYENSTQYFYKKYVPEGYEDFTSEKARSFPFDDKLWGRDVSFLQKDFIAQCFVSDKELNQTFHREFGEKLEVFSPREPLLP